MKKLFVLIALITLASCKKEPVVNYAIISGTITQATAKKITVRNQFNLSESQEIELNKNGVFIDTVFINKMNSYAFYQDKNSFELNLSKGDNITINYNSKNLDSTLTITGKGSNTSSYLNAKRIATKNIKGKTKDLFLLEEKEFKEALLKIKSTQSDVLFIAEGLSELYKKEETKNINYEYLSDLANYELYHGYYSKNREFKASENFLDELKNVSFDNGDDFLFSTSYRGLAGTHFRQKAQELAKKDTLLTQDIAYLKVVANVKNNIIRNKLLYDDAQYGITFTDNLEDYYSLFSNASTNIENNKKIKEAYNNIKKLAAGSISPKFTDYENNAGGKMSLDDLKGKYVYFDIWATWCGPCIAEIPSLKKIEKQFHNKNIEFVSISIDTEDAYDKWKKMILDKELGGIQLLADNNWESQFVEDYMIKGIPRFIIIDPEGKIINANAPRPSDAKLTEILNGLNL